MSNPGTACGFCLTCGKHVGDSEHECPYTTDMLHEAFDLVKNKANWKLHIDAIVPADIDKDLLTQAISFYTGSLAEIFPEGPDTLRVMADGYYLSIGS